jgi:hypothetical protein
MMRLLRELRSAPSAAAEALSSSASVAPPVPATDAFASGAATSASTRATAAAGPTPLAPGVGKAAKVRTGMARIRADYIDLWSEKVGVPGYSNWSLVGDTLTRWKVELRLDEGSLARELAAGRAKGRPDFLTVRIDMPADFPRQPPFIWIESPRFAYGTGFVSRGAVCMEMLVNTGGRGGWQPDYTLEGVLHTLRLNLQSPEAGGHIHSWEPYGESEARKGLQRARKQHAGGRWVEQR